MTGGSGGIGRALVAELFALGFDVVSLDLVDGARGTVRCDVSDADAVGAALDLIEAERGPLAVAVAAAGDFIERPLEAIDDTDWDRTMAIHLGGTANLFRAALPSMIRAGRGHLVAITSDLALTGAPRSADYAAAKGAMIGLVRALALELAPTSVRANLIAPGPTDTPMIPASSPYRDRDYLETLPARRLVAPVEIARALRLLIQDGDLYVGQVISPNAGIAI